MMSSTGNSVKSWGSPLTWTAVARVVRRRPSSLNMPDSSIIKSASLILV